MGESSVNLLLIVWLIITSAVGQKKRRRGRPKKLPEYDTTSKRSYKRRSRPIQLLEPTGGQDSNGPPNLVPNLPNQNHEIESISATSGRSPTIRSSGSPNLVALCPQPSNEDVSAISMNHSTDSKKRIFQSFSEFKTKTSDADWAAGQVLLDVLSYTVVKDNLGNVDQAFKVVQQSVCSLQSALISDHSFIRFFYFDLFLQIWGNCFSWLSKPAIRPFPIRPGLQLKPIDH